MRNLTSGNKMNFTIFAFIVVVILVILICAVVIVLKNGKEEYEVQSSSCIYDSSYNYIDLENDGTISKKWTGNYYLKENITKKDYKLGDYVVNYDKNRKTVDLIGTFYQVLRGGDVSKISGNNTVNGAVDNKFYKIDDRKYLIVAKNIKNETGSLSTQNYLIIIMDKLGNCLLLNNEINAKTINEMIISTGTFDFDVANEVLKFNDEAINLKKILGSTNEYTKSESKIPEDENVVAENEVKEENIVTADAGVTQQPSTSTSTTTTTTTTTTNNGTTTIIQNGNSETGTTSNSNNNSNTKTDNSWVGALNNWIQNVASGFQSIYNGSSGSKKNEEANLNKSIALNSLSAGTTHLDINYTVTDPENKYNVVYATVSDGVDTYNISLDKNATTYRLTGLKPNTNYTAEIGYKIVYADSTTTETVEDTMTVRTTTPSESLKITKVSTSKVYYTLKLDSNFVYDAGAKLKVYLNDTEEYLEINLTNNNLEKAASSGYSGSFSIPAKYKNSEASIKIVLEDTKYNGNTINTNLIAKIVNY